MIKCNELVHHTAYRQQPIATALLCAELGQGLRSYPDMEET